MFRGGPQVSFELCFVVRKQAANAPSIFDSMVREGRNIITRPSFPLPATFLPMLHTCCALSGFQSTTSGKQNWYWNGVSDTSAVSIVQVEMLINKFEFTTVQEVDPVDLWAIIGAIGGVWRKCTLQDKHEKAVRSGRRGAE